MTISPVAKKNFLGSVACQCKRGVSLAITHAIVERVNTTLGIAFANYSVYAADVNRSRQVAERTIPALCRLGLMKKYARRNGPPVLWIPELMDMDAEEAVRRVEWYVRNQGENPSGYFAGGSVKNDVPSAGSVKNDVSGYVKNDVHNPVSNNLSLRERARRSRVEGDARPRGARLRDDWHTSQADRELARRYGLTDRQIGIEETKFRNYWTSKPGKAACKLNWPRTWENWIITAAGGKKTAQSAADVRAVEPAPDPRTFTLSEWRDVCDVMLKNPASKWPEDRWGTPPGVPGCLMPQPMQAELARVHNKAKAGAA
jgi:hypothetical protein